MAKRGRPSVLAAWLNRHAQPQADGTYLVRTLWRVYEVDSATKDRWIKFQVAYRRFGVIALAIFILALQVKAWPSTWDLVALVAVLFPVWHVGLSFVLRGAKRVSRDRWQGPLVVDRFGHRSRRYYLVMTVLCLFLDALVVPVVWAQWHKLDAVILWQYACVIALFTTCAAVMLIGYRRTSPKPASSE